MVTQQSNASTPVTYTPIGVVRSPLTVSEDGHADGPLADLRGEVELDARFEPALKGIESFSHVVLYAHMHRIEEERLCIESPKMEHLNELGIFACRSARRPNPLAETVVRLCRVHGTTLEVEGLDLADGTPVLDIKPYVPPDVVDGTVRRSPLSAGLREQAHEPESSRK
jgi:formylmethanofuran dehydrogenase subunit E